MRILILNQYFPPDPAPTGVLFAEIAVRLRERGHEAEFIDAGEDYRAGQGKGGRMRREAASLWRMLRRGFRSRRAEVVISGSSPPCLLVVADLIARRHGARSIHWCMDLYPDIAVALGEIRVGLLSRTINALMGWCYRRAAAVVALDEDMADRLARHGVSSELIRPWVTESSLAPVPDRAPLQPWTWLYSGNLGRAHEWETLLAAQSLLEAKSVPVTLTFQGGGPSRAAAQERASALGLQRIDWRPYAPEDCLRAALLDASCLVVTERPEVKGLLWPSKLALMLALPRPILFVGPPEGAIARQLRALPHAGVFAPGDAEGVAKWISQIQSSPPLMVAEAVLDPVVHRDESIQRWIRLIEG